MASKDPQDKKEKYAHKLFPSSPTKHGRIAFFLFRNVDLNNDILPIFWTIGWDGGVNKHFVVSVFFFDFYTFIKSIDFYIYKIVLPCLSV